jgi:hypothetical protein
VTLTVADIGRWSAEAVREVFHAGNARGQATLKASRQLSSLTVFDAWEGATAGARKHANASIRQDLDAHGNEALAVARAAGKAADEIEHVQSELRTLLADANGLHMTIDQLTNKVIPSSTFNGPPMEAVIAEMQLQPRLDKVWPRPTLSMRSQQPQSTWLKVMRLSSSTPPVARWTGIWAGKQTLAASAAATRKKRSRRCTGVIP